MRNSAPVANSVFAALVAESCTLTPGCRLLAFVLAQLADWRTGRGIAGQGRLARAMGVNVRTVQRLKAELAACEASPVIVTWRHRQRADGLNGSDSYTITLRPDLLAGPSTGHPTDLQRHPTDLQRHPTLCRTNITSGVPLGNTSPAEREFEMEGKGSRSPPCLVKHDRPGVESGASVLAPTWRPNATHAGLARKLGVDLESAVAGFVAHWGATAEARSPLGWARGFSTWLKNRPPSPVASAQPAQPDDGWVVV